MLSTKNYNVYPNIGTNKSLFKGKDDINDKDIALTNIQCYYIPPPGGTAYTSTYNSLKACNIYGNLKALGYTRGGVSLEGRIFADRYYNYNYKILPTIPITVLGYQYNYIFTSRNDSISGFVGIN